MMPEDLKPEDKYDNLHQIISMEELKPKDKDGNQLQINDSGEVETWG